MEKGLLSSPKIGKIDQGSIFNGCIAEDYIGCEVFEVIINARCDIENDKIRKFNYLPVVKIKDWISRDFWEIFIFRIQQTLKGKLRNLLSNEGKSPEIVGRISYKELRTLQKVFKKEKQKKAFIECIETLSSLAEVNSLSIKKRNVKIPLLIKEQEKISNSIFKELIQYNLTGYYYLEKVSPEMEENHFIVLLREVIHLDTDLVSKIKNGLSNYELSEILLEKPDTIPNVRIEEDDMIKPVGTINSPYIEHLMQKFANLFIRIGVDDLELDLVTVLLNESLEI